MTFAKVVSLCCCVAAFGVVVAACGVLWPPFPPLFLAFGPLKRHPPFAFPPSLCLYACVPAGTRAGGLAGRLARMSARKQAGVPTVSPAKERGFLKGCILLPLRGSIWRCRGSLWRSLPGLIATHLAFGLWPLFGIFTIPMPVCQRAGRQAQGQADWQAGEQAGGQECLRIRKHIDYKHEELFFTCAKCSLVDILAHSSIAFQQFLCLAGLCSLAFPRSNACMPACRQAGTRASRLAGR